MNYLANPFFPVGLNKPSKIKGLNERTDVLLKLLNLCPEYMPTDLFDQKALAKNLGLNAVLIKR